MSINTFVGMGRLTTAPELRMTASGIEVATFTIAIARYVSKDKEIATDFINCVAWRQTATFVNKNFGKGDMIAVTGSLQQRKYTDKDGKQRSVYEIVVDNVSFCGSKSLSHEQRQAQASAPEGQFETPQAHYEDLPDGDDLPF